jgi:hypothetical protein
MNRTLIAALFSLSAACSALHGLDHRREDVRLSRQPAVASPAMFPLDGVIPGWTEGLQLMVEGEKRRFWIPEELAYKGRPGAPAGHAGL